MTRTPCGRLGPLDSLTSLAALCALLFVGHLAAASPQPPDSTPSAAATALPPGPVNLDFEQGEIGQAPEGWEMTQGSLRAGFGAEVTDDRPYEGQRCVFVRSVVFSREPASGVLAQSFDAAAWRGKRVRFRAAVRTDGAASTRAQLWMTVERPNHQLGFVDDMADRPIQAAAWRTYEIVGDVAPDAVRITLAFNNKGFGTAWIDGASFDILDTAPAGAPPSPAGQPAGHPATGAADAAATRPDRRPLSQAGLARLAALARLLGYVRYFHPSDQAADADWSHLAVAAVAAVTALDANDAHPAHGARGAARKPKAADEAARFAALLQHLLQPLAPTLRVYPTGSRPPALDLGLPADPAAAAALRVTVWRHVGLGMSGHPSPFSSLRTRGDAGQTVVDGLDPRAPLIADLGAGVSCALPLALFADDAGTLPRPPAAGAAPPAAPAASAVTRVMSMDDRDTRLATVMLAWNVTQHFQPSLPASGDSPALGRWNRALPAALSNAATIGGEGVDTTEAMLSVLRRMLAATGDGQATIVATADPRLYELPLHWDWIEDRLVVTAVDAGAAGAAGTAGSAALGASAAVGTPGTGDVHPGDVVTRIGDRDVRAAILLAESETPAATPQWRRWRALTQLSLGPQDAPLRLTLVGPASPAPRQVTFHHTVRRDPTAKAAAGAIREPSPGFLVVDLAHLTDRDLAAELPRLAAATGVVFDLRGYVRATDRLLAHLVAEPVTTRAERLPLWLRPDRQSPQWNDSSVQIAPQEPRLHGRLAFLAGARDIAAAEAFLATVADRGLGPIVGAATGGASGSVDSMQLPAGFTLIWTASLPPAGTPPAPATGGAAVQPTAPVSPTIQGIAAGRDEALDQALSLVGAPQP